MCFRRARQSCKWNQSKQHNENPTQPTNTHTHTARRRTSGITWARGTHVDAVVGPQQMSRRPLPTTFASPSARAQTSTTGWPNSTCSQPKRRYNHRHTKTTRALAAGPMRKERKPLTSGGTPSCKKRTQVLWAAQRAGEGGGVGVLEQTALGGVDGLHSDGEDGQTGRSDVRAATTGLGCTPRCSQQGSGPTQVGARGSPANKTQPTMV